MHSMNSGVRDFCMRISVLKLDKLRGGLGRVFGWDGDAREGLAHFGADVFGDVEAGAVEELVIDVAFAAGAVGRRDGGGEGLDFAGVVFPAALLLRPRGGGEEDVGFVR